MPDAPLPSAAALAERIREAMVMFPFDVSSDEGTLKSSMSLGVAVARPGDDPTSLLKRADAALYLSKENGRNRISTESQLPSDAVG